MLSTRRVVYAIFSTHAQGAVQADAGVHTHSAENRGTDQRNTQHWVLDDGRLDVLMKISEFGLVFSTGSVTDPVTNEPGLSHYYKCC